MLSNEEFEAGINEILAEDKLSDKALQELEGSNDEFRMALNALIAEGEIFEKDGKYYPKGYTFND